MRRASSRCTVVSFACLLVLIGCAAPPPGSESSAESRTSATSSVPSTTVSTTTTTTVAATTTTSTPTTTTSVAPTPDFSIPSSWIGVEFNVTTRVDFVEDLAILANLEHIPVDILVGDQPSGVYGWYQGGTANAFTGPSYEVVVVGDQPNPYMPNEYSQEVEGVQRLEPDPTVLHDLMVWAIESTGPASFMVLDAMPITLHGGILGYGALWTIHMEPWRCELDPPLEEVFAFFEDTEDLEIEQHYSAELAFIIEDGRLTLVPSESVRCIVRLDPENF